MSKSSLDDAERLARQQHDRRGGRSVEAARSQDPEYKRITAELTSTVQDLSAEDLHKFSKWHGSGQR